MREWLTHAQKAVQALIAAAAAVLAILLVDWWPWLLGGIAIAAALYASAAIAWRHVRGLQAQINTLRAEVAQLSERVAELVRQVHRSYEDGVDEGKMQWIGATQSQLAGDPPLLVELSHRATGHLVLVAEYGEEQPPIPVGTRYEVRLEVSGEPRGVVQVTQVNQISHHVHMICVDPAVPEFWSDLERLAIASPAPPEGIRLARMSYPLPRALATPD